MPGLFIQTNER